MSLSSPSSVAALLSACRASPSAGALATRTIRKTAGAAAPYLSNAQAAGPHPRACRLLSRLREQLIGAEVDWLDGVLFTHDHADHTHGIDDLRPLFVAKRRRVDAYLDETTSRVLHARFGYCFATPPAANIRRSSMSTGWCLDAP